MQSHLPMIVNREYSPQETVRQAQGKTSTELSTAEGFPLGIWIDYGWEGICPNAELFALSPTLLSALRLCVARMDEDPNYDGGIALECAKETLAQVDKIGE